MPYEKELLLNPSSTGRSLIYAHEVRLFLHSEPVVSINFVDRRCSVVVNDGNIIEWKINACGEIREMENRH